MNRVRAVGLMPLLVLSLGLATSAQGRAPTDEYRWLVTSRVSTMEKELNEAATLGYRVGGAVLRGQQLAVLIQHTAAPSDAVRYRVVSEGNISSFERELQESADEGFRYVSNTVTQTDPSRGDIRVVLEQDSGSGRRYEYFVGVEKHKEEFTYEQQTGEEWHELDGEPLSELAQQALDDGYALVGLLTRTKGSVLNISVNESVELEHVLIAERPAAIGGGADEPLDPGPVEFVFLGGTPGHELQAALSEVGAAGYRLALVASSGVLAPPTLVMEKGPEPAGPFQYLVVAETDPGTLRRRLNDVAASGFRVHPQAVFSGDSHWVIVERMPDPERRYLYNVHTVIEGGKHLESLALGWSPNGMSHHLGIIVVEKASELPLEEVAPDAFEPSVRFPIELVVVHRHFGGAPRAFMSLYEDRIVFAEEGNNDHGFDVPTSTVTKLDWSVLDDARLTWTLHFSQDTAVGNKVTIVLDVEGRDELLRFVDRYCPNAEIR